MRKNLIPFLLAGIVTLVILANATISFSEEVGGGSGISDQSATIISPHEGSAFLPTTVVATFNRSLQVITKNHGSELGGLGTGQAAVWKFTVYGFSDVVGHVNPETFTVTAVDMGRSGETIRIRVSKVGTTGTVTRSAASPGVASYGLSVADGDTIKVIVDYPNGFLYGNSDSAYAIQWALQNTAWIVP